VEYLLLGVAVLGLGIAALWAIPLAARYLGPLVLAVVQAIIDL
jgi:hypothetical protein